MYQYERSSTITSIRIALTPTQPMEQPPFQIATSHPSETKNLSKCFLTRFILCLLHLITTVYNQTGRAPNVLSCLLSTLLNVTLAYCQSYEYTFKVIVTLTYCQRKLLFFAQIINIGKLGLYA
jgi:hypothetical protein